MPDAVQGASSKMASNGWPSHQLAVSVASPQRTLACRPSRVSVPRTRSQRAGSMSSAITSANDAVAGTTDTLAPARARLRKMLRLLP